MKLKCGVCDEEIPEAVLAVCHHCGKPLCERHQYPAQRDRAFVDPWYKIRWYQLHLLIWRPIRALLVALRLWRKPAQDPLRAMHCRNCKDRFHAWSW